MRVLEHKNFNAEFPEKFNWGLLDSPRVESIAKKIASAIEFDALSASRNCVPGLREALRIIAEETEV